MMLIVCRFSLQMLFGPCALIILLSTTARTQTCFLPYLSFVLANLFDLVFGLTNPICLRIRKRGVRTSRRSLRCTNFFFRIHIARYLVGSSLPLARNYVLTKLL